MVNRKAVDAYTLRDLDRFVTKVDTSGDCWEWQGTRHGRGYGYFRLRRSSVLAHRLSYELLAGRIAEGLTIDHLCRNRLCVRPDHLEPVDAVTNTMRGFCPQAVNARKTHCPAGHPLSGDNLYVVPKTGWRQCRTCTRARQDARRAESS